MSAKIISMCGRAIEPFENEGTHEGEVEEEDRIGDFLVEAAEWVGDCVLILTINKDGRSVLGFANLTPAEAIFILEDAKLRIFGGAMDTFETSSSGTESEPVQDPVWEDEDT